jgi:hypothetical protein
MIGKLICAECRWRGDAKQLLTETNPFDTGDEIYGCPQCRTVGRFETVCDEPGCWRVVGAGTPTPTGYRLTCWEHRPKPVTKGN